jgi:hypothetical protein
MFRLGMTGKSANRGRSEASAADAQRDELLREEVQMHRYRIAFLSGLAAGFVLGTRAGRERYEQIKQAGKRLAESPAAQQAAGAVQAQAAGIAKAAKQRVTDELHDRMPKLAGTAPGRRQRNGHAHEAGNGKVSGEQRFTASGQPPGTPSQGHDR